MYSCYVSKIILKNFRRYDCFELSLGNSPVLLIGENGSGKTTILEAISLMACSNGMRSVSINDMQKKNAIDSWVVFCNLFDGFCNNDIQIVKSNNRRVISVNGKGNTTYSLLKGLSTILWFTPEMDCIFLNSKLERMKFFGRIISLFEKEYVVELIRYNKAKVERSKILKYDNFDDVWLSNIESIISCSGIKLSEIRLRTLKKIQPFIKEIDFVKSDIILSLKSDLLPLLSYDDKLHRYEVILRQNREKDFISGRTTFGAHNDNIKVFNIAFNLDISLCSTGEQKITLLRILLASVKCYGKNGYMPIMLLDDILSHLDSKVRGAILYELLQLKCQVWISALDASDFTGYEKYFNLIKINKNE